MSGKQQEHIPAAMVEVVLKYKRWLVLREDAVLPLRWVGTGGRGGVRVHALTNAGLWPWEGESGRCAACAPRGQNGAPRGARRWPGGGCGGCFGRFSCFPASYGHPGLTLASRARGRPSTPTRGRPQRGSVGIRARRKGLTGPWWGSGLGSRWGLSA